MQEKKPETYRLSSPSRRLRGSLASYLLVTKHRDKIATFYKQNARKYTHTRTKKNVCFKISLHFANRGSKARLFFFVVLVEEAGLPRRASGKRFILRKSRHARRHANLSSSLIHCAHAQTGSRGHRHHRGYQERSEHSAQRTTVQSCR